MLHTSIYLNYLLFRNGSRVRLSPWAKPRSLHAQDRADLALTAPVHANKERDPAQAAPVDAHEEEGEEEDPINV